MKQIQLKEYELTEEQIRVLKRSTFVLLTEIQMGSFGIHVDSWLSGYSEDCSNNREKSWIGLA
ncbi:hypothetical protein [Bacillus sp. Marseille-P3661]|uniref:hypothetical protein n=1 Tax=Bacillus sp. Marseille-P3661 TaxID=1936234 RepID=UPI000C824ADF|nr:hypothetical protein [Bacillus sp. Marseille-P3661]